MLVEKIQKKIYGALNDGDKYLPVFFRPARDEDKEALDSLLEAHDDLTISDSIKHQLIELVKSKHPGVRLRPADIENLIDAHIGATPMAEYGVWVYYPWKRTIVHLLDEEEFVSLRTNRNKYKITEDEQSHLAARTIGIIGLSVGQSIALTIAMERTCGTLRLADFDTADLSNLNRLRTGVHNIGIKKTVIAAREIAEIDPFIKVELFSDGITEANIDSFFSGNGPMDLLVEVCDGLDIKIMSRFKARELGIPVVMDTNDRGMIDIERFDLQPGRPILHGLADGLDPQSIKGLTNEAKIPYILRMVGATTLSTRMKASMLEVEQSISTWPQLASSVALGGGVTTDICRRILLGQLHVSGRFYIDCDDLIKDDATDQPGQQQFEAAPAELTLAVMEQIAAGFTPPEASTAVEHAQLTAILNAACLAPSGGNAQPWKFLLKDNYLYIFHDVHYSFSLLDYNNSGSYIAFGAMLENIDIMASSLGLSASQHVFPLQHSSELVAVVSFAGSSQRGALQHLAPAIPTRVTNRNVSVRTPLEAAHGQALSDIASTVNGAKLLIFDSEPVIAEFADVLTRAEMIRLLNPRGHYDTFVSELRFTPEQTAATCDGLDVLTLNMSEADKAVLQIAQDAAAIEFLHTRQKGEGFAKLSRKAVVSASAIGVLTMDGHDAIHFLNGGRALERVWLEAATLNISLQPVSQAIFLAERALASAADFNPYELRVLLDVNDKLKSIVNPGDGRFPVFVFRLFYGESPKTRSLRRPLERLTFANTNK